MYLCIFMLCEYLLASFSFYVIVYSCVNMHLCVFVCSSACHVSLLERYKLSAFVYLCISVFVVVPTLSSEF